MKTIVQATAIGLATFGALPAMAETKSYDLPQANVAAAMDALEGVVTGAGATVFARVNHGAGAASVEMELADAELLIFGNPRLGTPALQADILAGLQLPLRVLVYQNGDTVVMAYETAETMFDGLNIPAEAEFVAKMNGALAMFAGKVAE